MKDNFFDLYDLRIANDNARRDECLEIRHEVYCRECGFEPTNEQRIETDECDDSALHFLLSRRTDDDELVPCGTIRLIFPDKQGKLPVMRAYDELKLIAPIANDTGVIAAPSSCVEVSRFAVLHDERARPAGVTDRNLQMAMRPASALALACCHAFDHLGVRGAYMLTEPALIRSMAMLGLSFIRTGEDIEYRGTRAAFFISTDNALTGPAEKTGDYFHDIGEVVAREFARIQRSNINDASDYNTSARRPAYG